MAIEHDPITQIVNVQWEEEEGFGFLYSGTDGMWGSQTGETWERAPSSVPAISLAFADGVWVAAGRDGCWRSEDGATTWDATGGPNFFRVAAMELKEVATDGTKGIFAGWNEDEEGDNALIHISRDLGKTWAVELSIPTSIPFGDNEDGYEIVSTLSGCGNGLFVTTQKGESRYANGDGMVYSSIEGSGFLRQEVWTGTNHLPPLEPGVSSTGYGAAGIGFDPKSKTYSLVGYRQHSAGPGGAQGQDITSTVIYAISASGTGWSGENTIAETVHPRLARDYEQVGPSWSCAGGAGKFVTGIERDFHHADLSISGDFEAHFFNGGSGSHTLISVADIFKGGSIGSFCFRGSGETATDGDAEGTFACVAFGTGDLGGVFISKNGGDFQQTHSGQGPGTVAVGTLSFLETETA